MKKIIYLGFLIIALASCGENDFFYKGEQFFAFGQQEDSYDFLLDEENHTFQVPFGLAYPADKDIEFNVKVLLNTAGEAIKLNGRTGESVSCKISKGEQMGYVEVSGDFDQLVAGELHTIRLKLNEERKEIDYPVIDSSAVITIQKVCKHDMKDWEGIYKIAGEANSYEITITHAGGDTLQLRNLLNLESMPEMQPAPVKFVLDPSANPYVIYAVEGYFYTSPTNGVIEIRNNYQGEPYYGQADNCSKFIDLVFLQLVNGSYYLGQLQIIKVRDL